MKRACFLTFLFIVTVACNLTTNFAQSAKSYSPPKRTEKQEAADDDLLDASEKGDTSAVKAALKAGANLNTYGINGTTPLICASRAGKYSVVKLLLDAGANPVMQDDSGFAAADVAGMVPISSAATSDDSSLEVQVLSGGKIKDELAAQAKVAKTLSENLIDAILAKDNAKAAALIKQGAYIDFIDKRIDGRPTPLISAVTNGQADIVDLLISRGVRVDRVDKNKRTALIYAANYGFTSIAEHLINAGAWIDFFDSEENTPLTVAIGGGFIECVQMLINHKVNVNGYLTGGMYTPLIAAIGSRHPTIVPILLKAKADPDKTDVKGSTALMFAAFINDIESAKLLLKAGADPNLKNKQGHTALEFAKAKSPEIAKLLEALPVK